jgi:hypothetical protein
MTHMPAQFRVPTVLIQEWRRRAADSRLSNPAAADVYERCASELEELDVHTEGAPAHGGGSWRQSPTRHLTSTLPLGLALLAGAVFAAGLVATRSTNGGVV